jgi:hypothetical protein|tara:strand:- start:208 stop:534 length:327 start_codon:yes stop_codon:yes gene_type:complete
VANIYTNAKADFTDTSNTTVYTSPAATTSIIKSILVSEDSGNADTITVTLTSGASVFNLFKTKAVGSNTTIELLSQPLIIQENEILKAQAATGNRLHMVISVLQINRD